MSAVDPVRGLTVLAIVAGGALLLHVGFFRALFRFGWRTEAAVRLQRRARWPARATTLLVALLVALPSANLPEEWGGRAGHLLLIALILALSWLALRLVRLAEDTVVARLDLDARDNLRARRRQTQTVILRRVATVVVALLAGASILLTFPGARSLGTSLLASAGVVGVVAGVAARSTFGNLVAGLQIAFAEPIRLGDMVVVEDEWGRVEEINLTTVVVRTWDRRRLVLPAVWFTENPFENWSYKDAQVIGQVSLHLDHRVPVGALREELRRVLDHAPLWDGEVQVLQVIGTTETTVHVRALVSAEDGPQAWDLRCQVREELLDFLQREHAYALPRTRIEVAPDGAGALPATPGGSAASRDRAWHAAARPWPR